MITVAIVGAGIAGLTAALRLAQAGYRVEVFERYPQPGGLARILQVGGEPLEAFYHHIFTSDEAIVRLIGDLGLADRLEWRPSRMGIWCEGRLWDFGTPASLLRFRPLGPLDAARFALSTLWLQTRADPAPFENVTAAEWLRRHQGEQVWRVIWEPLFRQKFADRAEQVAMVWLWGKMRLRGRSRSSGGLGERLGYMRGSFGLLVEALASAATASGAALRLGRPVLRLERDGQGLGVVTRDGRLTADRVLVAAPVADHLEIAGELLGTTEREALTALESTSALCTTLELDRPFSPYYWLNIADAEMPFGGLIEHTNFVPADRHGGRSVLYISNYLLPGHPLLEAPRAKLLDLYLPALARINPDFDASWVREVHHVRARSAQPVVTTGYRARIPAFRTSVDGLYLCTMAQIYPWDRGMNYAVEWGDTVARLIDQDLQPSH